MRTGRVIAMRVALQAFQLNSSSRNISWLTYLALSVAVTKQIGESSLWFRQTPLGLTWIRLFLFGPWKGGGMWSWSPLAPRRDFSLSVQSAVWRARKKCVCSFPGFALLLQDSIARLEELSSRVAHLGVTTQRWAWRRHIKELPHLG